MIKSITYFLIIFFIFQQLNSQIDQNGVKLFCDETLQMKNKRGDKKKNPSWPIYHDNIDINKDRTSLPQSIMVVGTTI